MGLDFLRQRAKAFNRSWDHHRVRLGTPSLFSVDPACAPRTAVARTTRPLEPGTGMLVRSENGDLVGYDGHTRIALFVQPPSDLVAALRESGGYAEGRVVITRSENVVEVSLC